MEPDIRNTTEVVALAPEMSQFTRAGVARGMRDLTSAIVPAMAFGIGFGAAAVAAGLTPTSAVSMSALVFAGASQYAALDLWHAPMSFAALLILTLAVNARHLVLGATLHGYLSREPALRRHAVLLLLSDANWAATQQAIARGDRDVGHLLGGGLVLWSAWLIGTLLGAVSGKALGDLERLGIDSVMPAFFACALIGLLKSRTEIPPWGLAGAVSGVLSMAMPVQWAILIGTFAGGVAGVVRDARG